MLRGCGWADSNVWQFRSANRGNIAPDAVCVVQVPDVAAAAARAEELGGKVVVAPNKLGDGMVIAYLTDPNGSLFALFSPAPAS